MTSWQLNPLLMHRCLHLRTPHYALLPRQVFASIGRTVFRDIGPTALGFRFLMKIVDYNFFAWITAQLGSTTPDYKRSRIDADATLAKAMTGQSSKRS